MKKGICLLSLLFLLFCQCEKEKEEFVGKDIYFKLTNWPQTLSGVYTTDSVTTCIYSVIDTLSDFWDTIDGCEFYDKFLLLQDSYIQGVTINKIYIIKGHYKVLTRWSYYGNVPRTGTGCAFELQENGEINWGMGDTIHIAIGYSDP